MPNPVYPVEPRCYPVGNVVHTNPVAPLTPYIYNGVTGRLDATSTDLQKRNHVAQRDTPHSRADPECPRCRETRTFYAHVSPDPQRRGPARVEREAASWMATHPCIVVYAHPRRHARGAAA